MGITDNIVQLHRMKRDLGIVVDTNPISEYLNETIICKTIKKHLKATFLIDDEDKGNSIREIAIEKAKKLSLSNKIAFCKKHRFYWKHFTIDNIVIEDETLIDIDAATIIYHTRIEQKAIKDIAQYYKVTYTKADDYYNGIFEVKKVPRAMTIFKEYGVEALIWLLINKQQFNKLYPKAMQKFNKLYPKEI